jgi:hypothetical protein
MNIMKITQILSQLVIFALTVSVNAQLSEYESRVKSLIVAVSEVPIESMKRNHRSVVGELPSLSYSGQNSDWYVKFFGVVQTDIINFYRTSKRPQATRRISPRTLVQKRAEMASIASKLKLPWTKTQLNNILSNHSIQTSLGTEQFWESHEGVVAKGDGNGFTFQYGSDGKLTNLVVRWNRQFISTKKRLPIAKLRSICESKLGQAVGSGEFQWRSVGMNQGPKLLKLAYFAKTKAPSHGKGALIDVETGASLE